MRGEHRRTRPTAARTRGSSPHARGAQLVDLVEELVVGIIPACAGSTLIRLMAASSNGDHPRMRGEHCMTPATSLGEMGSSPHARGARGAVDHAIREEGIIPACAGST